MVSTAAVKPKLRGVFHEIAFYVSLVTGPALVVASPASERIGVGIYSVSLSSMFGASALYHRPTWRPDVRKWLRKIDHSMIFVFIAGTFTPIAYSLRADPWARHLLLLVWIAAFIGMIFQLSPIELPKSLGILPYFALGWFAPTLMPETYRVLGLAPIILLGVGGLLYTLGALAYAREWPNPKKEVFGYHELFHVFVIGAAICHYVAVIIAVHPGT